MKKLKRFLFYLILVAIAVGLLMLSWKVDGFSDAYVKYVFPIWGWTYGLVWQFTNFSIGEILIYIAVAYTTVTVLFWILRIIFYLCEKETFSKFTRVNTLVYFRILIIVFLLLVQNCFVLYHETPLFTGSVSDSYVSNANDLMDLREKLVTRANELSEKLLRDENGNLTTEMDIAEEAKKAMLNLGQSAEDRMEAVTNKALDAKLSLLRGYYPKPKHFVKSDFFSQQGIAGYYFPFTLEANYNDMMYIANIPATMCHELSHLKGFIYEDEATFIAYLACVKSDNMFFEYSAILDVLGYVNNECIKEIKLNPSLKNGITAENELVVHDMVFLTDEAWEEVEADAVFDTEIVNKVSDEFIDTNLTINGVSDGIKSYSRVVTLLLKYYYGGDY